MSSKNTLLVVGTLAVIVAVVVLYARRDERPPSTSPSAAKSAAERRSTTAPAPIADAPEVVDAPSPRPRVRRLADPKQRDQILEAIRQARQSRGGAAASGGATKSREETVTESDVPPDEAEYIKESVRAIVPLLVECYEQALERAPDLEGRVVVDFTIEGEPDIGGVIGASEIADGTSIEDEELRECMTETMYAIEIDPPAQGGTTHVTYPFEFRKEPPEGEEPLDR